MTPEQRVIGRMHQSCAAKEGTALGGTALP